MKKLIAFCAMLQFISVSQARFPAGKMGIVTGAGTNDVYRSKSPSGSGGYTGKG